MKKTLKLSAVIMLAVISNAVKAQTVNTAVGANVLTAITLTENSQMHFGTMTVPTTVATVILSTAGARTNTGTINLLAQAPLAVAAAYTVAGEPDATYAITLPTSTSISNGGGGNMIVNSFTCSYPLLVGQLSGFSGEDNFTLGATLNLASSQATGIYAGTFNVSVAYN
ncbi:MAG: DUF4402 domain-containing protein [Gloeobacteraceae cyanobacterium ES-bin-316]|nr:DUF4402 domain-containing protein [Ferruginibacter sp.]